MKSNKIRVQETRQMEPSGRQVHGKTYVRVVEIDDEPKAGQVAVAEDVPLSDWEEKK